jgi:hypothetical protein
MDNQSVSDALDNYLRRYSLDKTTSNLSDSSASSTNSSPRKSNDVSFDTSPKKESPKKIGISLAQLSTSSDDSSISDRSDEAEKEDDHQQVYAQVSRAIKHLDLAIEMNQNQTKSDPDGTSPLRHKIVSTLDKQNAKLRTISAPTLNRSASPKVATAPVKERPEIENFRKMVGKSQRVPVQASSTPDLNQELRVSTPIKSQMRDSDSFSSKTSSFEMSSKSSTKSSLPAKENIPPFKTPVRVDKCSDVDEWQKSKRRNAKQEEHVCRSLPALGRGTRQYTPTREDIETNISRQSSSASISVNISGEAAHNVGKIEVLIHPGTQPGTTEPNFPSVRPISPENKANYVQALQEIQLLTSTTLDSNLVQTQALLQRIKEILSLS